MGFRYNNCCVGTPVARDENQKPTAPYGIVSTGRYCDKQGPPCIMQDSKDTTCKTYALGCQGGIEGMIKGGGKVCCPAGCAGPRFSGAPNACGGPGCDKGPDGVRTDYRYNNCCVGKDVTGANVQSTITASYGIVSQGRFCAGSGMGTDAPPCINKLSAVSDRL